MGKIFIGDDVNINSRNIQTDLVSGPEGKISIGDSVSINFGVSVVANKEVKIGNRVRIGPYTMIYDSNLHVHSNRFKRADGSRVIIEDDVWLASRVIVLQGSRVGKGSLIAAGSIVTGIIPPYVVAAGSPAKIVKYLNPPENSGFMWERKIDRGAGLDPEILDQVRRIAAGILPIETNLVLDQSFHDQFPEWDSFHQVKFINALENKFDITFDKEELVKITNIRKATSLVQNHLYYFKKKEAARLL
ncbi:MAG: hypothetical protein HUJ22_02600 [Gracilimonas sp.]|uniref:phosphopantetheine-binding protein n=1 Tax=Gracilimonas sp. TaxID=1974203 RepID=UPI0019A46A8C|nr:phosphopantetheine-binding protein [Gracilimonas sp.]MBD3615435.1 hypothetical protein [Gracilimonas sp.]